MFPPRLRRGTRHPDAPPSSRSASESVRADTLRALGGKRGALPMCCPAPLRICGLRVRGIPPVRWGARGFRVRPVPSELGRGRAVAFLACCLMVSLVRAEGSVPSVATSGCPKRSEGGCPCRSEDVHRPSSKPRGSLLPGGWVLAAYQSVTPVRASPNTAVN